MRLLVMACIVCLSVCCSPQGHAQQIAGEQGRLDEKSSVRTEGDVIKEIRGATAAQGLWGAFEELSRGFFREHRYTEFAALVGSLGKQQKFAETLSAYYCALNRYRQLKYLEETQGWDEYFSKGNDYRDEIVSCGSRAASSSDAKDPARVGARLVLWRFHRDQQDAFEAQALDDLMAGASDYAKAGQEASVLKEAADTLAAYGEKGKSKELYRLYVSRLALAQADNESLLATAAGFLQEGNRDLAESLYDRYLDRLNTPELRKADIPRLVGIAKNFCAGHATGDAVDSFYAEKIFALVEQAAGDAAFDEDLMAARGLNLERMGEWRRARELYATLLRQYPATPRADTLTYKMGVIAAFVEKDSASARDYLKKSSSRETLTTDGLSSLYYLGLLSQWEGDLVKAKEYYDAYLSRAGEGDSPGEATEGSSVVRARLKEIEEGESLEYNQKLFLDASLGPDALPYAPSKVALFVSTPATENARTVNARAEAAAGESGCMQVAISYLWSGDAAVAESDPEISLSFRDAGTKVISLVAVSSSGVVDRVFAFVDLQ